MNGLIVFVKDVSQSNVKTRLAATIGIGAAQSIYDLLIRHTREVILEVHSKHFVFFDGSMATEDGWRSEGFVKHVQHGSDLGERMANAFEIAFDGGCQKVIIVGSDIPDLSEEILEEAFEELDDHDFVVGPANDGGYYLLGMRSLNRGVFRDISWSSPGVMGATLQRIHDEKMSVAMLQQLTDIDTVEDLKQVKNQTFLSQIKTILLPSTPHWFVASGT